MDYKQMINGLLKDFSEAFRLKVYFDGITLYVNNLAVKQWKATDEDEKIYKDIIKICKINSQFLFN